MLSDETRTVHALHQSGDGITVVCCDDTHIAPRLLHHHGENESTVDMMFSGALVDCGLDVRDVRIGVRSGRQSWQIDCYTPS